MGFGHPTALRIVNGRLITDMLVSDGTDIRMGQTRITPDLNISSILREQAAGKAPKRHWLRPLHLFLDDSYFQRVGWHYSDTYHGGGNVAGAANAGKLLVFDDRFCYGAQWEGTDAGRYPNHLLGAGSRINADRLETENIAKGARCSSPGRWRKNPASRISLTPIAERGRASS